ncbi:sensor histidine kinase [Streptomyces sp. NBC_00582]|uniref:sensor histidine kinase n=1 Tax=Streptomyces sp. NBC_00582 TaxID=2975783 RepID=UPI002E812C1A|nr:HAMP domain-containing sensor histidine kinase [Streptomyces sp. NBC_00582]WUB59884.1 HAMP domain-containing histidine kinase [Streptomyces sp. NBC_00582]
MTRIPLRKRLLVRLLFTSVLIAVCSVAATAWLAVATTTRALREEQGQALADDMDILAELSGYAATHPTWKGVEAKVRALSAKTDRRIALTTADRTPIADSAPEGASLPPRAAATVDPLSTDTYTERGAQLTGVDPRAVGPYRLTSGERHELDAAAAQLRTCYEQRGYESTLTHTPGGRPVVTADDGSSRSPAVDGPCQGVQSQLDTPMSTEQKALRALEKRAEADCPTPAGFDRKPLRLVHATGGAGLAPSVISELDRVDGTKSLSDLQACLDDARIAQLDPYVAPTAQLFLGGGDNPATPRWNMSPANKAKVFGTAGLVLALTVAVSAVVATRLVRPLRALTEAAQQPPDSHARVPVTTRDETGILAEAFNDLAERREKLEAQRKALVADVAHELRSPLTNIRGWLEVTRDGLVEPDPALLGALHEEAVLLQRVIDDLRDLAAADAGTLRLHREPVPADDLLAQVAAAHRVAAQDAGVTLRTGTDGTPWLDADPVRLRQALGNLVANAVRHTPPGGTVTLGARRDGGEAVLTVGDTGTGIAAEDLPYVFDRFWRAEKSRSRRTGGSGLGLAIVRQLVAAHGGTAEAASTPGTGSTFTLRLPAATVPAEDRAEEARTEGERHTARRGPLRRS